MQPRCTTNDEPVTLLDIVMSTEGKYYMTPTCVGLAYSYINHVVKDVRTLGGLLHELSRIDNDSLR